MAEPMDRALVEALMQRAGLALTDAEVASLHGASGLLQPLLDRLHGARPPAVEPATTFAVPQP